MMVLQNTRICLEMERFYVWDIRVIWPTSKTKEFSIGLVDISNACVDSLCVWKKDDSDGMDVTMQSAIAALVSNKPFSSVR